MDVILLASKSYYDELDRGGYIEEGGDLLENSLTVIGRKKINDIREVEGTVAIGDPGFVPAGRYAKEAFMKAGIWEKLEGDLLLTKDVRSALAYANMGEADYSVVYKTESLLVREMEVYEIPEDLHSQIVYSGGSVRGAGSEGKSFYSYLVTRLEVFEKYGFKVRKDVN